LTKLLYGCDVSKYQPIGLVDWRQKDFGIGRLCYGTYVDPSAPSHAQAIRAAGKVFGGYHFFRADLPIDAQVRSLAAASQACTLGPGDMIHWIDVEDSPGHTLSATDAPALQAFAAHLVADYGAAGFYITQRDFGRLGKPAWLLEHPLWVAHYPGKGAKAPLARPATPAGAPWRLWQWLVGPLGKCLQDASNPLAVDQSVATDPLPLLQAPTAFSTGPSIPWATLNADDWHEMTVDRDRHIQEENP
jgi:GH25 family lysozyme M1 (1,4-beta-N-acetylmuramidase)